MALADAFAALVAAYDMDDASDGTRLDMIGSNDLADTNGCPQVTGILDFAAGFTVANLEELGHADATEFRMGSGDWFCFVWFYIAAGGTIREVYGKKDGSAGLEWLLENDLDIPVLYINGGAQAVAWSGTVAASTWHLAVMRRDSGAGKIGISLDGGNFVEASGSEATGTTAIFHMGAIRPAFSFEGSIDENGVGKGYLFTNADAAALWNGGTGVFLRDWVPPVSTGWGPLMGQRRFRRVLA